MACQSRRRGSGRSAAGLGRDGEGGRRDSIAASPAASTKLFGKAGESCVSAAPLVGFEGARGRAPTPALSSAQMQVGQRLVAGGARGHGPRRLPAIKATPAVRALGAPAQCRSRDRDAVRSRWRHHRAQTCSASPSILAEVGPAETLRGFRRAMAQNMALAQSEVAAATVIDDADIDAWPQRRRRHDPARCARWSPAAARSPRSMPGSRAARWRAAC